MKLKREEQEGVEKIWVSQASQSIGKQGRWIFTSFSEAVSIYDNSFQVLFWVSMKAD